MSLPGGLPTITVTGQYMDAAGNYQAGSVSFIPTSTVVDAAGKVVLTETAIVAALNSTGSFSLVLPCTDTIGLTPPGWGFSLSVNVPGATATITPVYLPHALGSSVDISALTESFASPAPSGVSYYPNVTSAPTGPSAGGGFLYANAGALYWVGPSNVPHLIAGP